MQTRFYSDRPQTDAAEIAREVVLYGESAGWKGAPTALAIRERILAPFNIVHAPDRGAWALRRG